MSGFPPSGLMHRIVAGMVIVAIVVVAGIMVVRRANDSDDAVPIAFVGSASCANCHSTQFVSWQRSQHAVAMQDATPGAVLGRFDSTRVTMDSVTSLFFQRGDRYFVNTEGTDGRTRDFEIAYTFGVHPLQQYLVEFAGGRMQALAVAWDARPDTQGGQRWFSLNPGRRFTHEDEEHWTGRLYNWNFRCADCHSTAVRKGYDASTDRFTTSRSEISVGCEACHGPGERHTDWAGVPRWRRWATWRDDGLVARLTERRGARWVLDSGARTARRDIPRATDREIETCAQCHARRIHIADNYVAGAPLTDYYIPALIEPGLYHVDGQQLDEVYNYGSFLQSRMYRAGVTCSDCHDPHAQRLRAPGNAVCAQCHRPDVYDRPSHDFHPRRSPDESRPGPGVDAAIDTAVTCAACHMPTAVYMEIDRRRDHSIRVPRPDLSLALGVPNACTDCHVNRDERWADAQVRRWYGRPARGSQNFAHAFAAGDEGSPGAADSLTRVLNDSAESTIARATALARLAAYSDSQTLASAYAALESGDVLMRLAALQVLDGMPMRDRLPAVPALSDDRRSVRQGAAWLLAAVADSLPRGSRDAFTRAAAEFVASQRYNADQPDHRVSLAHFYARRGQLDSAIVEYRAAIPLAPRMAQPYVDLAEVLRASGDAAAGEQVLRDGVARMPSEPGMYYALGQHLVRVGRPADAIAPLARAASMRPDVGEFARALAAARAAAGTPR
jgi:predicted CXXCH cytochrome family protein